MLTAMSYSSVVLAKIQTETPPTAGYGVNFREARVQILAVCVGAGCGFAARLRLDGENGNEAHACIRWDEV